jgi:DNA-binding NarL/FixJ family response regulator
MTIKVVITDDHPIVADGMKHVLELTPGIQVTGVYHSAPELLQHIATVKPDVLILDRQLQDSDSVETVQALLELLPSLPILVFSSTDNIYHVKRMMEAGCHGYLLKDADNETLLKAIETLHQGGRFLSPILENTLLDDLFKKKNSKRRETTLSKREKEILNLIVKEYTNQEIASTLFLSLSTVEFHRTSMLQKMGVKNTAGLVRVAVQTGLV